MGGCNAPVRKGCTYCETHRGGRKAPPPSLGNAVKPAAVSASGGAPKCGTAGCNAPARKGCKYCETHMGGRKAPAQSSPATAADAPGKGGRKPAAPRPAVTKRCQATGCNKLLPSNGHTYCSEVCRPSIKAAGPESWKVSGYADTVPHAAGDHVDHVLEAQLLMYYLKDFDVQRLLHRRLRAWLNGPHNLRALPAADNMRKGQLVKRVCHANVMWLVARGRAAWDVWGFGRPHLEALRLQLKQARRLLREVAAAVVQKMVAELQLAVEELQRWLRSQRAYRV